MSLKLVSKKIYAITLVFICFVLLLSSCNNKKQQYIEVDKNDVFVSSHLIPDDHFVGDKACAECHKEEVELWSGSHHDKAMQIATEETILANFNNVTYSSQGVVSKFFQKEDGYYVNTEGPDGKNHDYKIEYTFGVTPLQQYIVKFPNGHYQCLRTAWDTKKNKWFDLYPDFKVVHSEWLHWSRGGLNWNNMCADCHSTNVRKNYNQTDHSYDTKYAIINVNCEACHGPGKKHVEEVQKLDDNYKSTKGMWMTSNTAPKDLVDQCARCHMRREQYSECFNFEGTMMDHYFPQVLTNNLYYPDGQILDEVYVYGSFLQSKMYQNNVTCTNCHEPHSLKLRFEGNTLCLQCHEQPKYDVVSHHFHKAGSDGAQCINCHMDGKVYMGNDYRRDHSFRIPRPDQSIKYGTPNACIRCHSDKSNEWAWEHFKKNYGEPDYTHFSDLLAPGFTGEANGYHGLFTMAKDTLYPEIARASAINSMTNYLNQEVVDKMLQFLNDESPIVRGATIDVLSEIPSQDYVNNFLPLLKDPKRTVRVKAFFAVASLDELQIPEEYNEAYKKVKKEFEVHLSITSDFAGGRAKRGSYYLKKGDLYNAIKSFESALEIDNRNNIIRTNLANLYYRNSQFKEAEEAFKTIISQEPEFGQTYYSYALLLGEQNRTEEAIEQMQLAIKYMPENTRFYYNLSLLYDKLNNFKEAENVLVKGLKLAPQNGDLLYVLAYLYQKQGQLAKAKNIAQQLVQLYPNNQQYVGMYNQLRQVQ
ncbi:tetratricopeptide repeat protein [Seonamhaeicola aphaedonensis]|uniref:Putative CXXCH cytochrome family protein n=1 Tax=Seonamhaeicola aphaedonensis TaxID=1461338 RepID=A0A3D9H941_9FLAO|nr:tetratricopeptide repeat protein [Seonamhaeicola aphaedonensis]RED45987.1 putative CXXCH cytochrome family protein [Seonamhaeicola aphaedonensis]